jgi:thiol-disulfide isomerase/thioredoxin
MIKKILLGIVVCIVLAAGGFYYWLSTENKAALNNSDATRDNPAPQIRLTELNGNPIELSSLKGKPVFMNFWATWCPPCVAEMPFINELYPEYKDKVQFVMVSVDDPKDKDKVVNFIADKGFTFPVYTAEQADIAKAYNIQGIPTTYIINDKGNIKKVHVGGMTKPELRALLDKAANGK